MINTKIKIGLLIFAFLLVGSLFVAEKTQALQPIGTHIKDGNGTIFYLTNQNTRRPYTSWGAFTSYRNNSLAAVQPAAADDLSVPAGDFIPPREGTIICSDRSPDKGTCYFISQGLKLGFTSEQVFTCLGYSFNQSFQGDISWMPAGATINNCNTAHPVGTAVNLNGVMYLVGQDGLYAVPDQSTFLSWGYGQQDVVPVNSYDQNLNRTKTLSSKPPGFVGPFGQSNTSLTFNPFAGQTISAPTAPTISFTVNGQNQATVHTGEAYTYQWNVTGADSVDSYYQANAADTCSYPYPGSGTVVWDASQASGTVTRTADICRINKTYTITLRAHKAGAKDVIASVQVIFLP